MLFGDAAARSAEPLRCAKQGIGVMASWMGWYRCVNGAAAQSEDEFVTSAEKINRARCWKDIWSMARQTDTVNLADHRHCSASDISILPRCARLRVDCPHLVKLVETRLAAKVLLAPNCQLEARQVLLTIHAITVVINVFPCEGSISQVSAITETSP